MAIYKAFAPGVEVNGEAVLALLDGMGTFRATGLQILAENGIADPKRGSWYPQQRWLDAMKAIAQKIGSNTLFSIGQSIPATAKFPPSIKDIQGAMASIDVAYHMNHRNGEIGHYTCTPGERQVKMVCENPYPCEFDRGIIDAMATRFQPRESSRIRVTHDSSQPCRKLGGNSCTYLVSW